MTKLNLNRRQFMNRTGAIAAGTLVVPSIPVWASPLKTKAKLRVALVGTGIRGNTFWGRRLVQNYRNELQFVGLCDKNDGRVKFATKMIDVDCPTFTDFDRMMTTVKPDLLIVTTMDSNHHEFIIKGLEYGINVITEKPMTTDETKCQAILDAEQKTGKKVIVGFNYRYATLFTAIKEQLVSGKIGDITSVDFHWYLNTYHGASYFRRWHGEKDKGGTLLVHKSTHHFDLLNWFIDSDPVEVFAYGALEHYGKNNPFRGDKCRTCAVKDKCKFYWDITKDQTSMDLYVANEHYDGYIRDNCLWRENIDIYDKMAVQIKYANNVSVSYSLTTYSPYEGWRIAFNGMEGRLDSWEDIPWRQQEKVSQAELHAKEMSQDEQKEASRYNEIVMMRNWEDYEIIKVPYGGSGHGGGDSRLQDKIFKTPDAADPLKHAAGSRDGAFSVLVGIAARKSIEEQRPVQIEELTKLKPMAKRQV
jgi:predicted dehydrogenase